jgi:hypothetical protein
MRTVRLATPLGPLALAAGAAVTRSLPLSPAVRRALAHVSRDRLILIVTFRSIFGAEAVTLVLRG